MKRFEIGKIVIFVIIISFCARISASPAVCATAIKIMQEIKVIYQTEKADKFLDVYLKERNLSAEQILQVKERINYFFNSQTFVQTGAAYLTAMFSENDLVDIFNSAHNGDFLENKRNNPAVKKVQKMFAELDPYLYRYLRQNIIPQPSDVQEDI